MPSDLYRHPLFTTRTEFLSVEERISLSYQRARLIIRTYNLSASDVQYCSARYWSMMTDPVVALDAAMYKILVIHIGLVIGSLSRHLHRRSDLVPLVNRLLRFETAGLFLLSERGHGLDAFNIETIATKTAQGFVINTPREEACKYMAHSSPLFGIPKVGLVMARLMVDGEDRGSRFFIVSICDEHEMVKGVESIRLGPCPGVDPLDHSITRFDHVVVPYTALVASNLEDHSLPKFPLKAWWDELWRVPMGTMTVVAYHIPALKAAAFIIAKYSMHRYFMGKEAKPIPIISFSTQQWPILHAVAVSLVMQNWYSNSADQVINMSLDPNVRHGLAVIVKTTVCRHVQRCIAEVSERCGAQGTLETNFMALVENNIKASVITEGDILTLCIRLFSELLLQRYRIPLPDRSESLLARHAVSLIEEGTALLQRLPGGHRSEEFNGLLLTQAERTIEAMGHAMAYSSALLRGLPRPILDVYECAVVRLDPAWYTEVGGFTRYDQRVREHEAVARATPHLTTYLDDIDIEAYVSAPIVSDAAWKKYFSELPVTKGNAEPSLDLIQAKL